MIHWNLGPSSKKSSSPYISNSKHILLISSPWDLTLMIRLLQLGWLMDLFRYSLMDNISIDLKQCILQWQRLDGDLISTIRLRVFSYLLMLRGKSFIGMHLQERNCMWLEKRIIRLFVLTSILMVHCLLQEGKISALESMMMISKVFNILSIKLIGDREDMLIECLQWNSFQNRTMCLFQEDGMLISLFGILEIKVVLDNFMVLLFQEMH